MGTLARRDLAFHVTRTAIGAGLMFLGGALGRPWLALVGGVVLHLASFTFAHDVGHGALGVPRKLNEWLVALVALPMLVPGHTNRIMHQRHHARPLTLDDVEGMPALVPFWQAVLLGPMSAAQYRLEALKRVNARERQWQLGETAGTLLLALWALQTHTITGAAFVVANIFMQLTAAAWASHLPHRPPKVFMTIARHLLWTKSALILSFVFHQAHHAHPKVPCAQLAHTA